MDPKDPRVETPRIIVMKDPTRESGIRALDALEYRCSVVGPRTLVQTLEGALSSATPEELFTLPGYGWTDEQICAVVGIWELGRAAGAVCARKAILVALSQGVTPAPAAPKCGD